MRDPRPRARCTRARNALSGGRAGRYARSVLPTGHLAAFALLSFALIVIPGPNVLFVVSRSLAETLGPSAARKTRLRIVRDGFLVGVTNPKAIVFFAAVLPQFVDRGAGHVPIQMLLLGAVFIGIAVASDSTWALAAGTARAWLGRSPRRLELIGGAGGLVMIGIGASLAVTGRKD